MDSLVVYASVIYLLTYRLAVLLLGGVCIYLGYRLFVLGLARKEGGSGELEANFGGIKLTLSNAAPGTFFATFGAIVTSVILMGSAPEFVYSSAKSKDANNNEVIKEELSGRNAETTKQLHDRIWNIHYAEAVELAKQVVDRQPDDPDYQDTLAALYFMDDKFSEAVKHQELALQNAEKATMSPAKLAKFRKKLELYMKFKE